jgi:hypothetical protein
MQCECLSWMHGPTHEGEWMNVWADAVYQNNGGKSGWTAKNKAVMTWTGSGYEPLAAFVLMSRVRYQSSLYDLIATLRYTIQFKNICVPYSM